MTVVARLERRKKLFKRETQIIKRIVFRRFS